MKKLLKLLRLNSAERWTLAQAAVLLPLTALILWLIGLRRSRRMLALFIPNGSAPEKQKTETTLDQARRISRLVNVVVRHGIYPGNCLQQSLVLWGLLRRQGIHSELHFGARKDGGRFEAHAWIELDGVVLNDIDDVRERYAPFDRAILNCPISSRS